MAILKVLMNAKGDVLGTARLDASASGAGAPQNVTLVALPGQRVIDVNVDDKAASLDPAALHAAIKAKYARPSTSTRAKAAKAKRSR